MIREIIISSPDASAGSLAIQNKVEAPRTDVSSILLKSGLVGSTARGGIRSILLDGTLKAGVLVEKVEMLGGEAAAEASCKRVNNLLLSADSHPIPLIPF